MRRRPVVGVLVVGAGIAGLTTALSLHAVGWREVRVIDAAVRLRPVGAGLNVLPNAVRELDALGLLEELSRVSVSTAELRYYHRGGDLILREPRGAEAGYRWPQLSIHRGPLQAVLLDAVRARLGAGAVTTGLRVVDLDRRADGRWRVVAAGPSGAREVLETDVLIGADGIRSAVRELLHPDHPGPRRRMGLTIYRGTADRAPFSGGRTMVVGGDEERKAVVYPLTEAAPGGTAVVNWAVVVPTPQDAEGIVDWNQPVPASVFVDQLAGWRFADVDVVDLIRGSDQVLEYPMADIDPLDTWSVGTATLVGDAAHAMVPMGSNGATQSVLDARAMAHHLAAVDDPAAALTAYDRLRRPAVTRIQRANREYGPEAVVNLAHRAAPDGFDEQSPPFSRRELRELIDGYAEICGFDVAAVNAGTPFGSTTG
ncbi:FAD-dependent monooxygenase [Saccharothrix sp. 6-C]|uniref:FAD-dependent monooxygenase n=1 Tax=Saccharothrix sp. 6-C TaxID=2781735 RepID=UPI001F3289C4|nr:FAD-dependent monooxygenase [Saccharothrix sp. 6-C]